MAVATKSVQRTLAYLRDLGYTCSIVEKFNAFAGPHGQREDLFGFIDILAIGQGKGIIGVQACGSDWGSHVKKITEERGHIVTLWLRAGGKATLIGWRKLKVVKKDGTKGKAERWQPRIADIVLNQKGTVEIHERKATE